jgi:MurNAc alpha-1-phosphate uridylyltransferase
MKAMIFAAGRGARMRPLSDTCPKPLLTVGGKPLIVWHLENLARAGISQIVINLNYLGSQIEQALGDGHQFGVQIDYSYETQLLETAGGIAQARALLGDAPFVAVSADIFCPQFDFSQVKQALEDNDPWGQPLPIDKRDAAWLYLVANPAEHPQGDFTLSAWSLGNPGPDADSATPAAATAASSAATTPAATTPATDLPCLTYSGIGVFRPEVFDAIEPGQCVKLVQVLRELAARGQLGGEKYHGPWQDIGTPERLAAINQQFDQEFL